MNCETCEIREDKRSRAEPVSFAAFESMKATMERTIKKLWIVLIISLLFLFGSNVAWIYYESRWEVCETTVEAEQTTDGGGSNYAIGGDVYGQAES